MKKITLLLFVLGVSLGYSQTLPLDFTDPLDLMSGADGAVVTIEDDGGNDVLQIVGNGTAWDNAQLDFPNWVDLSDDSNNTVTFRIKNTVNDGAHNHVLKFENGTSDPIEIAFTTEDDQWKNVSIDFPANLGYYSRIVIFTDFGDGNTASGTYLVDDIDGVSNLAVNPVFELPVGFNDAYNDRMWGAGGAVGTIETDPDDAGNKVLQIVGAGAQWDNAQMLFDSPIDLSDDANNTMRFKIRSTTAAGTNEHLFKFELPAAGGDQETTFTTTGTAWTDVELDFGAGLSQYGRLVIMVDWGGGPSTAAVETYIVDDISIGSTVLGVNDFDLEQVSVSPNPSRDTWNIQSNNITINKVQVFDVLGKQVMSLEPRSNEVTIDASNLVKGLYFAKMTSDAGSNSIKLIKN